MKKILILISLIIISLSSYKSFNEEIVIPDEAIRFRVVAKSNDEKDQEIKLKVKDNLQKKLNDLLKNSSSIEETRKLLKANQNEFSLIVKNLPSNASNVLYNLLTILLPFSYSFIASSKLNSSFSKVDKMPSKFSSISL